MLTFLFFVGISGAEANLAILNNRTFFSQVVNHPPNEVWFVLFVNDESASETKPALDVLRNASEICGGMVKFASFDVRRAPAVVTDFDLAGFPSCRIFHEGGVEVFGGTLRANSAIKASVKYVQDRSQNVTAAWGKEFAKKPSAILFAEKARTPLWAGVSNYFWKRSIRIGTCRGKALEAFKGAKVPSIVFYNGTHEHVYDGGLTFREVKDAIEDWFFPKTEEPEIPAAEESEMLTPDKFAERCIGGKQICVLAAAQAPPPSLLLLLRESTKRKISVFAGAINLPYKFMEVGGIWIYNPRKDGFLHVQDPELLGPAMDRVVDGSAAWVKRAQLEASSNSKAQDYKESADL
jgi:hypothetical protein